MTGSRQNEQALFELFRLLYNIEPIACEPINTSHGDADFREVIITTLESGERFVLKLADNDFTFPEKIKVWQRTAEEYRKLGYYCPKIISAQTDDFPIVKYKGHSCVAYAEEYSPYHPAETRSEDPSAQNKIPRECYEKDAWIMTAKIASEHLSYTDYPSGYCLFETFCPSDKNDEVLDNAIEWKRHAQTLPQEFQPQVERIWKLWIENRNALESIYKQLPTSVFQADLNPTNILIDKSGKFVGIYDFNLCGKDVFLNYLIRETLDNDYQKELDAILLRLKLVSKYYHFSEIERQAVSLLYRCIKPLWFTKTERLKNLKDDIPGIGKLLDETEYFLTKDIDFSQYMN